MQKVKRIRGELLKELLGIQFPLIMAPMFLVTNTAMLRAAMSSGIMSVFPSLNFRGKGEMESVLNELNAFKSEAKGNYGVNLIAQASNPYYKEHLDICQQKKVPFYITSLGHPLDVITAAHGYGAKVFCDITNLMHAEKAAKAGCDGFIAVGQGAGGHAGPHPLQVLIPALRKNFPEVPVVAAGGIATGDALLSVQALGAEGASVGTRFIACKEASVSEAYKQSIISSRMDDIVLTKKLSGTPCSVINNEESKRLGTEQNFIERFFYKNPAFRKWFRAFLHARGMKKLEKSILPNNYSRIWSAGKSVELIDEILSTEEIVAKFIAEYNSAKIELGLMP